MSESVEREKISLYTIYGISSYFNHIIKCQIINKCICRRDLDIMKKEATRQKTTKKGRGVGFVLTSQIPQMITTNT
ncbi:MAG TPA: hypothetical protein GX526_03365, partial [Thermoanaerobacterales bacterium]|nr:hypothetical protein [Thermoanaerobacterales bacterium]